MCLNKEMIHEKGSCDFIGTKVQCFVNFMYVKKKMPDEVPLMKSQQLKYSQS